MDYLYEIALSFAGEDRALVEEIATRLRRRRVNVFYDGFERGMLWGKDLYQHLFELYSSKSKYCVVFVSNHYASKPWTRHELKAAQSKQDSEYILPVRLDDTILPGLPETKGYLDARKLEPDQIVKVIMEKLGRTQPRFFRGMDLGHDLDPLRSALAKMPSGLFEEICSGVLTCYQFEAVRKEALAASILGRSTNVGTGWIRIGVFFNSFIYVQQLFQEIGSGVDKNVSRVLGRETYFSEDGPTFQLQGPCAVVIHSAVESVPSVEDIRAFGASLQSEAITNTIFFINESVYGTNYLGLAELRQMGVKAVVLCLDDLAYQVLTTETYRKYESKLVWAYSNSF
jgi:hypothetical protein